MIGLVLWFNPKARVGMIWCEDQGPLAFLGPEAKLPSRNMLLSCGDQVTFSTDMREGVRFVRDVFRVESGVPGLDPAEIVSGYHRVTETERHLRIVA